MQPQNGGGSTSNLLSQTAAAKSYQPRLAAMFNPLAESHKNITIKKILHEMEKDLIKVEEENY